ncbi:SDR family NAD(P)-dependent oxidoreductase [Demetria terragena]|uniref:SDR family NAD(P)-dependent oxidoreductase n=1 Tax=Demetria terragena TaxID=63959 RepID=UPI000376421F|nr:SDR family oxidoreductase [Demetria terragena]
MSKTLLVTGASKGIGLATVERFFQAENDITDVIMLARESAEYTEAEAELRENNPHGKTLTCYIGDLSDKDAIEPLMKTIMEKHGKVDLLLNNAGYTAPDPIHEIDFADFEQTIGVNLYAPFLVVQHLLHLGNQFEYIVNVASTAGITGRSGWLTYSSSKAALIAMSQVLKEELAIYGTRVICISPGRCATALRRKLAPDEDPSTIMQPEDVAAAIDMLTSPVGRFVDSENLVVRL